MESPPEIAHKGNMQSVACLDRLSQKMPVTSREVPGCPREGYLMPQSYTDSCHYCEVGGESTMV